MAMKKDTWNENALANPAMKSRDDSYSAVKLGAGEAFGIDAAMTNIEVGADNSLHVNTLNKNVPTNEKLESVAEDLQTQIDAMAAASDVADVVGTYADLQAYDTSKLTDNAIIKVLNDETQGGASTYYRWTIGA